MTRPARFAAALAALLIAVMGFCSLRPLTAQKPVVLPDLPRGTNSAMLLPNGWQITPAGEAIPLPGDLPLKMAVTRDGKDLIVVTGGYHDQGVDVMNCATGQITEKIGVGKVGAGLCLSPSGDAVYVSGGGAPEESFLMGAARQGASLVQMNLFHHPLLGFFVEDQDSLTPPFPLDILGLPESQRFISGLASGPYYFYAVNINTDTVYRLSGNPHVPQVSAKVGYRPDSVAVSPGGETIAVSNWGDKSVSLLYARAMVELARVPVGSHPNDLAYSPDGRLFVACSGSNAVYVLRGPHVREVIKTSLTPTAPVGSTPDALCVSPDGARLYVANADNNDVAVVDISRPVESRVLGFIPTGWYPSALAVAPDGKTLYVGVGKGLHSRPNVPALSFAPKTTYDGARKYDYIGDTLNGAVSIVPVPTAAQLAAYTRQVRANVPLAPPALTVAGTGATASAPQAFAAITHVLYIIRENRTYDQVLGDMKAGNGNPSLTLFGENITPNAHALARQFVLLDNLYCNGEVSEDGHEWCDSAYATDFVERAWPSNYSGRGEPDADARLTASPAGYLWDNCARHHLSFYSYGEQADFTSTPNAPPVFTGSAGLTGHVNTDWSVKYPFGVGRDPQRVALFLSDFQKAQATGQWPQFTVMWLSEDHTQGLKAGAYTPIASVASNDQALGQVVQAVSHSRFWPSTAIFVIEDDAQNGPDHVDAHRTEGFFISPYTRRGTTDSTLYSTASFVRTMELCLGLPPMTQFDAAAQPLFASFASRPDLTPFTLRPPQTDLDARNPSAGPGAAASAKLDFSAPDRADPDALNGILWRALKPGVPVPAPVRSARLP